MTREAWVEMQRTNPHEAMAIMVAAMHRSEVEYRHHTRLVALAM